MTPASAPATAFGFDLLDTLRTSTVSCLSPAAVCRGQEFDTL
jgi:hypothetical protein